MYTIHPTELEQFMKCPWAYHHSTQPDTIQPDTSPDKLAIFQEGDITEQLMTAYQYWQLLGDQVLAYFMESREGFTTWTPTPLSRLKAHAQNRKNYLKQFPADHPVNTRFPLFTQKRMHIITPVMIGEHTITFDLTGTADRVYSDGTIADCKTASRKRSPTDPTYKLQRRLYPLMWYKNAGPQHSLRHQQTQSQQQSPGSFQFTYYVFTKQVTPQLQVIPLTGTYQDSERLLNSLLTELARCIVNDDWPAKKNLACKRCDHRTECPLYQPVEDERF